MVKSKFYNLDTDTTLSENSDLYIPSQKATKTYIDTTMDTVGNKISNCILEIPQNIKLEIVNNKVVIKSGTTIVDTGETYATYTYTSDYEYEPAAGWSSVKNTKFMIFGTHGQGYGYNINNIKSGTDVNADTIVFNTNDKKVYVNGTVNNGIQYPICIVDVDANGNVSFAKDSNGNDMIFNGACFVGHHAIIYPNVKGLSPEGFTTSGTLNSLMYRNSAVRVTEMSTGSVSGYKRAFNFQDGTRIAYCEVDTIEEADLATPWRCSYVRQDNQIWFSSNGSDKLKMHGSPFVYYEYDGTTVTDFIIRQPYEGARNLITSDINGGSSRNVGEIVTSTIPLTDAGLHLLDGSLIQSGSYSDFVTYIAGLVSTYPDLFISEEDWQIAVTSYGVCGKFVYDSTNNTVRLPKITGFTEGTTDATALGDLIEAGLPNITGHFGVDDAIGISVTGAFYQGANFDYDASSTGGNGNYIEFDASRSNSIYGDSSTVQPQAIKVLYYIVIATSTKTDIQINIDDVMTDLAGKADVDLSNCTGLEIVHVVIETYQNGSNWYRLYDDGWVEQGGEVSYSSTGESTVNLIVPYLGTYYTFKNYNSSGANTMADREGSCYNRTPTSFKTYNYIDDASLFQWFAMGYGDLSNV